MSLRNTIDVILTKDDLIQLKNGKVKRIPKTLQLDGATITINVFKDD